MKKKEPKPKGIPLESMFVEKGFMRNYQMLMKEDYSIDVKKNLVAGVTEEKAIEALRSANALRDAITETLISNAAQNVNAKSARASASSKGGQSTGKARREEVGARHEAISSYAKKLLEGGKQEREVSSIVAERYELSAKQIRTILQRSGILKKRK